MKKKYSDENKLKNIEEIKCAQFKYYEICIRRSSKAKNGGPGRSTLEMHIR